MYHETLELANQMFSIIEPRDTDEYYAVAFDHHRHSSNRARSTNNFETVGDDFDLELDAAYTLVHVLPTREPEQIKQIGIYGWPTALFTTSGRSTPPAMLTDNNMDITHHNSLWSPLWS